MKLNIRPEGRNLQPTETDPGLRRDDEEKNRHPELDSGSQTPTVIIANPNRHHRQPQPSSSPTA